MNEPTSTTEAQRHREGRDEELSLAEESEEVEAVFARGANRRIRRWFGVLAVIGVLVLVWKRGGVMTGGYLIGALVAFVGLQQLEAAVAGFSALAAGVGDGRKPSVTGLRFLLRYAGAVIVGYVIFLISRAALLGFICGLFLPVASMVCEAGHEAWVAVRRS